VLGAHLDRDAALPATRHQAPGAGGFDLPAMEPVASMEPVVAK